MKVKELKPLYVNLIWVIDYFSPAVPWYCVGFLCSVCVCACMRACMYTLCVYVSVHACIYIYVCVQMCMCAAHVCNSQVC